MISTEEDVTVPTVFPHIHFTSADGVEFGMPRERVIHYETYHEKDADDNKVYDNARTFVNFMSPNHKSKGSLHAVVNMPMQAFREHVMRPAYEGTQNEN